MVRQLFGRHRTLVRYNPVSRQVLVGPDERTIAMVIHNQSESDAFTLANSITRGLQPQPCNIVPEKAGIRLGDACIFPRRFGAWLAGESVRLHADTNIIQAVYLGPAGHTAFMFENGLVGPMSELARILGLEQKSDTDYEGVVCPCPA